MRNRNFRNTFNSVALTSLLLFSHAVTQEKILTPEIILTIRNIRDVQLSPDGRSILFEVSRPRRDEEGPGRSVKEIWMMLSDGGEPWRFTHNDKSDRTPRWSPDGRWIAFLSKRGQSEKKQVYVIPVDGGEALQVTNAGNSVKAFQWSPEGSKIAYTVSDAKTEEEIREERLGRDWIVADQNYKHRRLFVVDVKTRESSLITASELTVHDFDWSPDGKQFVLSAAQTPTVDDSLVHQRLLRVPVGGGEPTLVATTEGKLGRPQWSPDGKWIAWLGATFVKDPYAGSVFVVRSKGGTPENLLEGYEGTAYWLGWQPGKPSTIVFAGIERQSTVLYNISLPDRERTRIVTGDIVFRRSGPSFSEDGKWMAMAANTPKHPNEIFFGEAGDSLLNRLTTLNPQLRNLVLGEQEVINWKSVDEWEIEGVLIKPVGYERGRRYPTVVQPHGGPESADLNGWLGRHSRWGQMLAGEGFVTLYPNYRGSIGRGVEFSMADQRDMMGKEFQDILAGIDYLVERGITDPQRVGIGGGSYGGYASAWAATAGTDRFKAAVMWKGISNQPSKTGTSDIFWELTNVHWDAILYQNYNLYWNRSPLAHILIANTPTLILHGINDKRVSISQAQEMYTALKWKGVPVEFVAYPREAHDIVEKAHQLDFMQRVLGWFEKYLKQDVQSN